MSQKLSALPVGSLVKDTGTSYNDAVIVWKIADKNHEGYPSDSVTLISDKILSLKAFDAKEPSNSNSNRRLEGNNRWIYSNIRQWLNSEAAAGEWYSAQHDADAPPTNANVGDNEYDQESGFLAGFSSNFKAALLDTTHTVERANADGGGAETCTDKIFFMSSTEAGFTGTTFGTRLAIFSDSTSRLAYPTAECVSKSEYTNNSFNTEAAWYYWLCNANASYTMYVRRVSTTGTAAYAYAYNGSTGVRPLCNLSSEILASDSPDTDGAYTIIWNQPPTDPSSITVPESIYAGSTAEISWGSATDPEGSLSGYVLERSADGGTFEQIYDGINRMYTDTIGSTWNSVAYRVKAYYSTGLESGYTTSETRTVIHNTAPSISGADGDLGTKLAAFDTPYTVTDVDTWQTITVTEKIDRTQKRQYTATSGQDYSFNITDAEWKQLSSGFHTLTITAADNMGGSTTRTFTFTKSDGKNRITIGKTSSPDYFIENGSIRSITAVKAVDIIGAELSVDQLTLRVAGNVNDGKLLAPLDYDEVITSDGYTLALPEGFINLPEVPYGTEVRYNRHNDLFGLFYTKNIDRLAANLYQINAMSAIGLLDAQQHNGGLYRGQTFSTVLAEIIGGAIAYNVDAIVANIAIYGWLPVASKRKNLHQLMFAAGASLTKDADGTVRFVFLQSDAPATIPDGRIYIGGNVDYSSPASAVEITEHTFYALSTDEEVTLFDNTDGSGAADNTFVTFNDAPVHDLVVIGNLTIVSSGVNYAILTGTGTLTGKKYTHVTKTVRKAAEGAAGEENVVTVTDATLVSVANSENVAQRVMAYYSSKKTVRASVVLDGEEPSDIVSFHDPYGNKSTGYISEMSVNVSSNLKADCTIITDYTPQFQGNTYTQSQLLTGSGTFTVGTNGAQVTMISGGQSGYKGTDGETGESSEGYTNTLIVNDGGEGGNPGVGGEGGRVLTVLLPEGNYAYSCGAGGSGNGGLGGDTTISQNGTVLYSTSNGSPSGYGVVNIFDGSIYATPGKTDGVKGGKGGRPTSSRSFGGYSAENVVFNGSTWYGGANAGMSYYPNESNPTRIIFGGAGGGAAVGNNGTAAASGENTYGAGGAGANASARSAAAVLGGGGDGGHGGGGGGAGGGYQRVSNGWYNSIAGGAGGTGGAGGRGGNGCILVYS